MKRKLLALLLATCMLALSLPMLLLPAAAEETAETMTMDDYLEIAQSLEPKTDEQRAIRGQMLVEYTVYQRDIDAADPGLVDTLLAEVAEKHAAYMYEYQYGFIEKTGLLMTFAVMSDVHINNSNNTGTMSSAMNGLLEYNPDPIGVFVTGDLSDNGLYPANSHYDDLDNYYAFVKNHPFKNSNGEQIKNRSVLGNHDNRGPWEIGYSKTSYAPAVEMYREQEGVDTLCYDMWIEGYHFIFVNPAAWASDDCILTAENISWLDATLSADQSGKPQFVFIHQYASRVIEGPGSPYTFEEVIARHPTTIVSSGHGHYGFDVAFVYEEAGSYYINQPGLVSNTGVFSAPSYYIVDVYNGGVIYRARQASGKWVPEGDVVIPDPSYAEEGKCRYYFYDEDGGLLLKGVAEKGAAPTVPTAPTKPSDTQNRYTFAGWDINRDGTADALPAALSENLNATAVYTATKQQYTYCFKGADGAELRKLTADYGSVLRTPGVKNLFGWDLDGDGAAEELPASLVGDLTAVAILKEEGKLTYTFSDADGYVIERGQVPSGAVIREPNMPKGYRVGDYFAGWDINGDGKPDSLPDSGITSDFQATALFYPTSQLKQFYDGTTESISYYMEIQQGRTILSATDMVYAKSPTAHAACVKWDGVKEYQYGTLLHLALPQEEELPAGYAVWIDAPGANGNYSFTLYKGKNFSHLAGETVTGDIYFITEDGKITKKTVDGDIVLPKGFCGWMVLPTETFKPAEKSEPLDALKFYFHRTKSGATLEKELYLGGGISFGCTVEEMNEMLSRGFSVFYDAQGNYLATTYEKEGKIVVPQAENDFTAEEGAYTFDGWDLNGDGVADALPESGSVIARAVYKLAPKQFTYRFVDTQGNLVYEKTADYGTLVLPPQGTVTNATGTYTITGYVDYEPGMYLWGDTTYTVTADSQLVTYTVRFEADGKVISEEKLAYGAAITAPAVPEKAGHSGKWEGYHEGMTVTGNVTFLASYTATGNGGGGGCGSTVSGGVYAVMALLVLGTGAAALRRKKEE